MVFKSFLQSILLKMSQFRAALEISDKESYIFCYENGSGRRSLKLKLPEQYNTHMNSA